MGNSAASAGWFFSEETTVVLLRLHDARCVALGPGEDISGVVGQGADGPGDAVVRKDEPVAIPVGAGTTLTIDFRVVRAGADAGNVRRALGGIILPLEHIARRCGGSLYHMWMPLDASQQQVQASAQSSQGGDAQTLEQFDRALRSATRDLRFPLVCLSLCQADSPQADRERYEFHADATERGLRFYSLLQSHAQHSRLLQSLYRQSRAGRPATAEPERPLASQLRDPLMDSWASVSQTRGPAGQRHEGFSPELPTAFEGSAGAEGGTADAQGGTSMEASRLRQEIEDTTREANARINQASEAIRTLKERLVSKQKEHEVLQRETARARRDADTLEAENEQLRLRLERRARERTGPAERDEELRRLRREAGVLAEQKDALVLILEDLYGATRPGAQPPAASVGSSAVAADAAGAPPPAAMGSAAGAAFGAVPEPAEPAGETWTNMLPRPSELFASGVLEHH